MSRLSPAQRHLHAKLAAIASATAPAGGELQGTAYELAMAQLAEHRRSLKDIQSIERKIDAKRTFLPDYDTWVDAALEHGNGANDIVLTTVLVWNIDVGNFARALQIARYTVQHGLPMPDQYERSLGVVLIDEFSTAALAGKIPHDDALVLLPEVLQLTAELDAPDQARAKLHKAIGYALICKTGSADCDLTKVDLERCKAAATHLQRALDLFDQVGVKKDIERLDRHIKKVSPPEGA
jgi:hypothetical protein